MTKFLCWIRNGPSHHNVLDENRGRSPSKVLQVNTTAYRIPAEVSHYF